MKTVTKTNCSGNDLLNTFKNLNIELGNVNANVINAWFDTDDSDTLNLLNWMCNSLSTENYVTALQEIEFNNIKQPLYGKDYENELESIQKQFPDILDFDRTEIVVNCLESEIEMLEEELNISNEILKQKEIHNQNLTKQLKKLTDLEECSFNSLNKDQKECEELAELLESLNCKIYDQIENYSNIFQNYEFATIPNFFSNIDIQEYEEKFQEASFKLKTVTQFYKNEESNEFFSNNTIHINESLLNTLELMHSRLYQSYKEYVLNKSKELNFKKVLTYLNNSTIDTVLSLVESVYLQMNLESKQEQYTNILENTCKKFAEINIIKPKLNVAQNELKLYESKLKCFTNIFETVQKILAMTFTISILYKLEQQSINSTDEFLTNIVNYTVKDLQNYFLRTNKMQDIINEYESYIENLDFRQNYPLIYAIMDIIKISNVDEYNLSIALDIFTQFKNEIRNLMEIPLKHDDFKNECFQMKENINTLQNFLISGPTNKVVVIPKEFQDIFNELQTIAKKQEDSLKTCVELCNNKDQCNKWQLYKRHLWMYFMKNPQKVLLILKEIKEFYNEQEKHKK